MYHKFQVDRYAKSGKCLCNMKSIHALLFIESVSLSDVLPCLIMFEIKESCGPRICTTNGSS